VALGRFSIKTKVTLVATLLFLASLVLLSSIQLYYVKAEIRRVLADQQLTFVSRVASTHCLFFATPFAELLGGRITVASEYGKGSTFTLQLQES